MPSKDPFISIITINYNQLEVTCEMLDSISCLNYPNIEVIVVDNHSSNSPLEYLKNNYPWVKLIASPQNLGFAGGNNLGIKIAKGDYLYFINNDTELLENSLNPLIELFEQKPSLGVVCPKICYYPAQGVVKDTIQYVGASQVSTLTARNKILGEGEIDKGQYKQAMKTAYAHGAAMLVSREVIDKVGMMPEEFFLYYEELDWSEQIRRAGFEIYVEPRAMIYHKESVSIGNASPFKTFYLTRNRILFMRRNRSKLQFLLFSIFLFFITIPKNIISFLLKGEFEHIKSFLKAIQWNYFAGAKKQQKELFPA
ncbi:MAG TPA: glycosyltransferase family 2 protein [Bacteroidetes bacterium]|nr:glycosyltransferase family 2 protein [Bacteroidota bacterium]